MAQIEIYNYLLKERLTGCEDYFSVNDIFKALKDEHEHINHLNTVRVGVIQLERFEYVEVKMQGTLRDWHRTFRIKKKYCIKGGLSIIEQRLCK